MIYTKKMYVDEIMKFCDKEYDPVNVAKKTSSLFNEHQVDIGLDLRDLMLDIITMEDGVEFEMTKEEFLIFLNRFTDG